jgi:hypothetical protein
LFQVRAHPKKEPTPKRDQLIHLPDQIWHEHFAADAEAAQALNPR